MKYEMEELIPIVADLAKRFTSGESSSVTTERAQSLMEAVIYCIDEYEDSITTNTALAGSSVHALTAYKLGYNSILAKMKQTKREYNQMIVHFHHYGNENYRDVVIKAIPGFFKFYNPRFTPQETIITMDYPTIKPVNEKAGIDAIYEYVKYIAIEQRFLGELDELYVKRTLSEYYNDYESMFCNICRIMLRHILSESVDLKSLATNKSNNELAQKIDIVLKKLVDSRFDGDNDMYNYLSCDINDFAFEIMSYKDSKLTNLFPL